MSQRYVRNLVGHDAGHLTFAFGSVNHAGLHEHWAARQRKCIYVPGCNYFEGVLKGRLLKFRWDRLNKAPSDFIDIGVDLFIPDDAQFLFNFGRGLAAESYIILNSVLVGVRLKLCL